MKNLCLTTIHPVNNLPNKSRSQMISHTAYCSFKCYVVQYFIEFSCCKIKSTAQTSSLVASVILMIIVNYLYLNVYKNSDTMQVILISQAKEKVYA